MLTLTLGLAVAVIAAIGSVLVLGSHPASAPAPAPAPAREHASPSPPTQGSGHAWAHGSAPIGGCAAAPSKCGFPDATNSGVPAGKTLLAVPGQVSGGPGWSYSPADHEVNVTGDHVVLSGLSIPYDVNILGSNVTIKEDRIVTSGNFGISLRHTIGVMIEDSTISGVNATTGRVDSAICDLYGDSTGIMIKDDNISAFRTAVQVSSGLVSGNYIHDPGYIRGDHTNGIYVGGGTRRLMIYHNTILNNRSQTDAINLDAPDIGRPVENKTIENNLLAGGSYTIYGGDVRRNSTSHIVIDDNWFSHAYYPKVGQWGPVAFFAPQGAGNAWAGNIWDTTGQTVPIP